MQGELFEIDKSMSGAVWWVGSWECRNHNGWFQSREDGQGAWCFQVPWFSNDDETCTVYRIDKNGDLSGRDNIAIDADNQILIDGKMYGSMLWNH